MLAKLLSLLAAAKGATAAVIVVAAATTVTVGATTPAVRDAVNNVVASVTGHRADNSGGCGQPVVVAQRNAADKLLRDAYQDAHKDLTDLRGGKDQDNAKVNGIVKDADESLRETLNLALNSVASLTLGREGQLRTGSGSPTASASPTASPTGCASPTGSASPTSSASSSASAKPSEQGRVAVAERTTLEPALKTIVDNAVAKMKSIVAKAKADVAAVPTPDRGKPSANPGNGNKPSENPGNKPSTNPGNRPSETPKPERP